MNPVFQNQVTARMSPARGVLNRQQREEQSKQTLKINEHEARVKELLIEQPALATQLYESLQGQRLPVFPVSGE